MMNKGLEVIEAWGRPEAAEVAGTASTQRAQDPLLKKNISNCIRDLYAMYEFFSILQSSHIGLSP